MHFHHTPEQAAGIAKARGMLMATDDPPAATVAALLAEHGCDDEPPVTLARHSSHQVTCDALLPAPDPNAPAAPVWVQVATAGNYQGYAGGAFTFDDKTFQQIVTNFENNPSFGTDLNGIGNQDVIPWDFNHASAAFAADGSIPITGTPAQGWVQALKVVAAPGGAQLWALTRWLEPARTYITENRYKWASVVVGFDCRDQKTNANIGAVLESIALTNNPFIEGMQKLAADRNGGPSLHAGVTPNMSPKLSLRLPPGVRLGTPEAAAFGRVALSALKLAGQPQSNQNSEIPAWKKFHNITEDQLNRVLNAARDAGVTGAAPEIAERWLLAQPASLTSDLGLQDGRQLGMLVSYLVNTLRQESQPVGTGLDAVQPMVTSPLSRTPLDATQQVGRNGTERAIAAMRANSPRFAALSFAEQVHEASVAVQAGHVVVA